MMSNRSYIITYTTCSTEPQLLIHNQGKSGIGDNVGLQAVSSLISCYSYSMALPRSQIQIQPTGNPDSWTAGVKIINALHMNLRSSIMKERH